MVLTGSRRLALFCSVVRPKSGQLRVRRLLLDEHAACPVAAGDCPVRKRASNGQRTWCLADERTKDQAGLCPGLTFLLWKLYVWGRRIRPGECRWESPVASAAEVDGAAAELGAAEVDLAAGEFRPSEAERAARENGGSEVDRVAGELGVAEVDLAAGELGHSDEGRSAGELGGFEPDGAAGELGAPEVDPVAGDHGAGEGDLGAGELGGAEVDRAAGELGAGEAVLAAGELGGEKAYRAAGELGAGEADCAPGELGVVEVDRAAGELSTGEVTAIKNDPREVVVKALPGLRRAVFQVRGDDPDDGVADFAVGLEGKPFWLGSILARIGLVWHAQIGAQHVDAGLPVFLPVIGQARQGIHPSQPDGRWLITTQFVGSRGEPFIQRPSAL